MGELSKQMKKEWEEAGYPGWEFLPERVIGNYTLLVLEIIPEDTEMYLIPNETMTPDELVVLEAANHHFVNGGEEQTVLTNWALQCLVAAGTNEPEYISGDDLTEEDLEFWAHRYLNYKVMDRRLVPGSKLGKEGLKITRVYHSGFIL